MKGTIAMNITFASYAVTKDDLLNNYLLANSIHDNDNCLFAITRFLVKLSITSIYDL